jgi:galactokinase
MHWRFGQLYGDGGERFGFFAPGRVNLIGEHTDYNGGYVFPCALSFGTHGLFRPRGDRLMKFASMNSELTAEVNAGNLVYDPAHGWANYLKGVIAEFAGLGHAPGGFELLIGGDIPNGSGLSSSASIELLMSVTLNEMYNFGLDMLDMVKLSQRAENQFVGVNSGIMDQFAVGMGKKGAAIFLDCKNLNYEYVPLELERVGVKLIIANTNYKRGLLDSKYNERRAQCETAVEYLRKGLNISCLGELSAAEFERNRHLIPDEVVAKRAEHIVYEDERALRAVECLKAGDIAAFGGLMNQSHVSLRDLYEVTGRELDTMAEEAWKQNGVLGSRMTGAGFGGCSVSLVSEEAVEGFRRAVGENYQAKTGLTADFYIGGTGRGAGRAE